MKRHQRGAASPQVSRPSSKRTEDGKGDVAMYQITLAAGAIFILVNVLVFYQMLPRHEDHPHEALASNHYEALGLSRGGIDGSSGGPRGGAEPSGPIDPRVRAPNPKPRAPSPRLRPAAPGRAERHGVGVDDARGVGFRAPPALPRGSPLVHSRPRPADESSGLDRSAPAPFLEDELLPAGSAMRRAGQSGGAPQRPTISASDL